MSVLTCYHLIDLLPKAAVFSINLCCSVLHTVYSGDLVTLSCLSAVYVKRCLPLITRITEILQDLLTTYGKIHCIQQKSGISEFYLHNAMLVRVYATAFLPVFLCVCVSHACFVSKQLNISSEVFYHLIVPPDSPIILVFRHQSLLNSDGFTPNDGTKYKWVRKMGNFWPISWCISETVRHTAIVAIKVE